MIEFIASVDGADVDFIQAFADRMSDEKLDKWFEDCRDRAIKLLEESQALI